tara:strand:+ start:3703 stop:4095 length:393 start_codon:yes stop_codon:yes gene_type:complete
MSYLLSLVGRSTGSASHRRPDHHISLKIGSPTRTINPDTDQQTETQHETEFLFHDTVLIKSEKLPNTSDLKQLERLSNWQARFLAVVVTQRYRQPDQIIRQLHKTRPYLHQRLHKAELNASLSSHSLGFM